MTHFASAVPRTHVPSAVARATLWIHLSLWESEAGFPMFRIFCAFTNSYWCQFRHDLFQFGRDETQSPFSLESVGLSERLWYVPRHWFAVGCFVLSLRLFLHSQLPPITGETNINASLTSFRYCEEQCTSRGDVLGYYSNGGYRN